MSGLRVASLLVVVGIWACAAPPVTHRAPEAALVLAVATASVAAPVTVEARTESCATSTITSPVDGVVEDDLEDEAEAPNGVSEEEEIVGPVGDPNRLRYTLDLSDDSLTAIWKDRPEALGSISAGFAHEGRLINAVRMPECSDGSWMVVMPTWGTQETVDYIQAIARRVKEQHPDALPLRVNQISAPEGGYVRPHRSHQNGRDVDLGFYYPTDPPPRIRERERVIDVAKNWSLLKAIVTMTDVQVVLVDHRVQAVLYNHALASGEDPAWLDSIFKAGPASIVQHARRHRDHFHVRFYNARAQELGHRVAPLLALRPEHNITHVRIKSGDTLSHLVMRYNTSMRAIQKANRMKGTFLRIGQVLQVPLRGPCNRCPVPPAIELPPRRLPPPMTAPAILTTTGTTSTASVGTTFSSLR